VAAAIAERWRRLVEQGYGRLDVSAARLGLNAEPPGYEPDSPPRSQATRGREVVRDTK